MTTQEIGNLDCTLIHILPELLGFPFQYILIHIVCPCIFPCHLPFFTDYGSSACPVDVHVAYNSPRRQAPHRQHAAELLESGSPLQQRCVWESCGSGALPSPERQSVMFTSKSAGCGEALRGPIINI